MTERDGRHDLTYYRCPRCDAVGYLPREFCPVCARGQRERCRALGGGIVTAATLLAQRPRDHDTPAPGLCLVIFDEGFTTMACSVTPLAAGARVSIAGFDGRIPIVESAEDADVIST